MSGSQPSICSEPGRNLYDVSEVCPWELEEPQTPSEGKIQKHVSIAPEETTAGRRGSTSGTNKTSRSQQKQKSGQSPANRRRSRDKGGERDEGREARKPPRSPLPLKPDICPWEFEEQPMLGKDSESISPDRIRRKKSVTPTDGKPKTLHSDHSKSTGSLLQPPTLMVEICPWDYHSPPSPIQEKTCSSPTTHSKRKRKGSCSSNHKTEREKGREKSRERRSSSSKPSSERRRVSQSSEGGGAASERRRSSTRDPEVTGSKRAEVCSWEAEPAHGGLAQTHHSAERRRQSSGSHKPPVTSQAKMADVCPWDFEDQDSGEKA